MGTIELQIKRYECLNCKSLIDLPIDTDITKVLCCKKPKLEMILFTHTEEPSQILGKCYEGFIDVFKYYLDFPEKLHKFLALWSISTYFYNEFETFPILFFNAMRGSAKTRTSKLVNYLAYKGTGRTTNNVSESAFFRHPTGVPMALDEVERIGSKELMGLRELINAVYKKGSRVQRVKKVKQGGEEKFVLDEYEARFPLTLANINGLEEVLEDRGFVLTLEKSNNVQFVNLLEDWQLRSSVNSLKRQLEVIQCSLCSVVSQNKAYNLHWNDWIKGIDYTTTLTTLTTLTAQTTSDMTQFETTEREEFFTKLLNSGIVGRNFELSYPLLITAKLISEEVFQEALGIIKELVNEKRTNEYLESTDVSIMDFVASQVSNLEFHHVKDLLRNFKVYSGMTDEQYGENHNEKWFGKSLKRLGLVIEKKRVSSGMLVILNSVKANDKLRMFKKGDTHE